jgi:hypothetical protein
MLCTKFVIKHFPSNIGALRMNTLVPESIVTDEVSKTRFAFILVISLFFLWGFSNNLNPILIPHLKKAFTLTTTQSTLVDSAVYIAYFALPAGYVMKRFGYKVGIITGLIFFSIVTWRKVKLIYFIRPCRLN